jgi:hypothetical protein
VIVRLRPRVRFRVRFEVVERRGEREEGRVSSYWEVERWAVKGVGRRFWVVVVFVEFEGDVRVMLVTGTWRLAPGLLLEMGKECTGPVKRAAS